MRGAGIELVMAMVITVLASVDAAAAPGAKIVGGAIATQHPGVVAVIDVGTGTMCSGFLVWQDRVLTAAHCAASADFVGMGADLSDPGDDDLYPVTASQVHPSWMPGEPQSAVALLTIAGNQTYAPLTLDLSPRGSGDVGRFGTAVGFGSSASNGNGVAVKRSAIFSVAALDADFLYANGPSPNLCSGDVGAPLIANSAGGGVIGVAVFADAACNQLSAFQRLDVIAPFLTAATPLCTTAAPCTGLFAHGFED